MAASFIQSLLNLHIPLIKHQMHAWPRLGPARAQAKPKVVRFAYKNNFHSPPNPILATPIATPSTGYGLPGPSPYTLSYPLKSAISARYTYGTVHAHPLLGMSAVTYDLTEHPSTITTRNNNSLSTLTLHQQSTTPPLSFITITSIHLPWIIKVYASNGVYTTVEDIFDSIYRALRTNITSAEFNLLPSKDDQRRVTRAYEKRYRRCRKSKAYEEEKRGGMKRVDFLMGHTKFLGISNTSRRPDEWRLHTT